MSYEHNDAPPAPSGSWSLPDFTVVPSRSQFRVLFSYCLVHRFILSLMTILTIPRMSCRFGLRVLLSVVFREFLNCSFRRFVSNSCSTSLVTPIDIESRFSDWGTAELGDFRWYPAVYSSVSVVCRAILSCLFRRFVSNSCSTSLITPIDIESEFSVWGTADLYQKPKLITFRFRERSVRIAVSCVSRVPELFVAPIYFKFVFNIICYPY